MAEIHEACGIMGVFGGGEVARRVVMGLYSLQHRGQESAGVACADGNKIGVLKRMGLVTELMKNEEDLSSLIGHAGIGHCRYSTSGNSNITNAQPIVASTKWGEIALAHNGTVVNAYRLRSEMEKDGHIFQSTSDTEVILHVLARSKKPTLTEALIETLSVLTGSFCFLFLTKDTIYAARDRLGFRPMSLGRLEKSWVIASETCALDLLGASYVRDIRAGELATITDTGIESLDFANQKKKAHCIFEFIYFSRPDSRIFEENCDKIRRKIGKALAKESPVPADIVIAVPDSSNTAALGYSQESGIPFEIGILRNHYVGRTFIDPSQNVREQKVKLKFNMIPGVIRNKRVVLVDDSIVRGTTLKILTKMLREAGAKEVHIRISSPPVKNPCFYGMDFPSKSELIASHLSIDETARMLGANSLHYLSIEGLKTASPGGGKNFCAACFDGVYPDEIPEEGNKLSCG